MKKPVLILMCGLPFAGKTTIARNIAARTSWQYISLDAINTERGIGFYGNVITADQWTQSYAEAYRRVQAVLVRRQSVIFDDTNFMRSQRDELTPHCSALPDRSVCGLPAD